MDKKKPNNDGVTKTGWWRLPKQLTSPKKNDEATTLDTVSSNKPDIESKANKANADSEPSTEGTMTGLFKKMDLF